MSQYKLSEAQANLAFELLALMGEHFPEDPTQCVEPLKVLLSAFKEEGYDKD